MLGNPYTIYVVDRGWVFIGMELKEDVKSVYLDHASVIRRWGTSDGLGQLALNGTATETVLDYCGRTKIRKAAILTEIECANSIWEKDLPRNGHAVTEGPQANIYVVDRGWVFIGSSFEESEKGVYINNASVIRRWGTQRGLGQLALEGKTSETILDYTGSIKVRGHAMLFTIECDTNIWTPQSLEKK